MSRFVSTITLPPWYHLFHLFEQQIRFFFFLLSFFLSFASWVTLLWLIFSTDDGSDDWIWRENKHVIRHQTEHLLTGFMGAPRGQWNTSAKSFEFDKVPITRNLPGECTAVFNLFLVASGLIDPHHTRAKFRKNNCFPVAIKPGRVSSASPFACNHLS